MSSYWISEDWKVKVETLESYLRSAIERGVYDHAIRAAKDESGDINIHINPMMDGGGIDYKVIGNLIYPADPAFSKPELGQFFAFMRIGESFRIIPMEGFTAHVNALDRLYTATKRNDQESIQVALAELKAQDEELGADGEDEGDD